MCRAGTSQFVVARTVVADWCLCSKIAKLLEDFAHVSSPKVETFLLIDCFLEKQFLLYLLFENSFQKSQLDNE